MSDAIRSAIVRGVGGAKCEGNYVYHDNHEGEYTLAGDDRDGFPTHVVTQFVGKDCADIREIEDAELTNWTKKWRRR